MGRGETAEEIDAGLDAARNASPESLLVEATYHPEPELELFALKISDGSRMVIPRE